MQPRLHVVLLDEVSLITATPTPTSTYTPTGTATGTATATATARPETTRPLTTGGVSLRGHATAACGTVASHETVERVQHVFPHA